MHFQYQIAITPNKLKINKLTIIPPHSLGTKVQSNAHLKHPFATYHLHVSNRTDTI